LPQFLVAPKPSEPLLLYVATTSQVVSAGLVAEREEDPKVAKPKARGCSEQSGQDTLPPEEVDEEPPQGPGDAPMKRCLVQHPDYFISMALRDTRLLYPQVQKLLLAVLLASHKLQHYFESQHITVVNSYSLGRVLHNRSATGSIAEWAMELSGFDVHFTGATTIKIQALTDFIAEWTEVPVQEEESPSSLLEREDPGCWIMYYDGTFSLEGAGTGVLLVSPTSDYLRYVVQLAFSREDSTNNTTEYEGLLASLRIIVGLGISRLVVQGDSQLVVNQVNKAYKCPQMWAYLDEVQKLERRFDGLKLEHIPCRRNTIADELS
jgi:ribonuclease HI